MCQIRCTRFNPIWVGAVFLIAIAPAAARAAVISFNTPAGSMTGGQNVNAKATFTTGVNQLTILLENLQADPKSLTQCLSGIQLHISTGETSGSLSASSGTERTVASNGSYVVGGSVATGWALSTVGSDLKLTLLGTPAAPDHTIIGPPNGSNIYGNANPSITNGVHSPFFGLSASFTLNITGLTAASSINAATFIFNTAAGNEVTGVVPEPGMLGMACAAGALLVGRRRRGI